MHTCCSCSSFAFSYLPLLCWPSKSAMLHHANLTLLLQPIVRLPALLAPSQHCPSAAKNHSQCNQNTDNAHNPCSCARPTVVAIIGTVVHIAILVHNWLVGNDGGDWDWSILICHWRRHCCRWGLTGRWQCRRCWSDARARHCTIQRSRLSTVHIG